MPPRQPGRRQRLTDGTLCKLHPLAGGARTHASEPPVEMSAAHARGHVTMTEMARLPKPARRGVPATPTLNSPNNNQPGQVPMPMPCRPPPRTCARRRRDATEHWLAPGRTVLLPSRQSVRSRAGRLAAHPTLSIDGGSYRSGACPHTCACYSRWGRHAYPSLARLPHVRARARTARYHCVRHPASCTRDAGISVALCRAIIFPNILVLAFSQIY